MSECVCVCVCVCVESESERRRGREGGREGGRGRGRERERESEREREREREKRKYILMYADAQNRYVRFWPTLSKERCFSCLRKRLAEVRHLLPKGKALKQGQPTQK